MLALLRSLFSPKVRARIVLRTVLSTHAYVLLQALVREQNPMGWMRYVPSSHVEMDLEAPRSRIEDLIVDISKASFLPQHTGILEVSWMEYDKRFETFRVAM